MDHSGQLDGGHVSGRRLAADRARVLVPVLYAIFVLDLKILKWEIREKEPVLARPTNIASHEAYIA